MGRSPGETECFHTEKLVRLARGFLCYLPASGAPPVTPLPAASRGHITFGSYNNLPKITPEVISLWSAILHIVPDARLVLKNYSLSDSATRECFSTSRSERDLSRFTSTWTKCLSQKERLSLPRLPDEIAAG